MPKHGSYRLVYDPEVHGHVAAIDAKHHSRLRRELKARLGGQPLVETRNRKPLLRPGARGAAWELRFGPDNRFRAFYRVNEEAREVYILAIGVKSRERLQIGGLEIEL